MKTQKEIELDELHSFASGKLQKPISGRTLRPCASARIDGNWLVCDPATFKETSPGPGMLEGFVTLHDSVPDKIQEYALRWGPLFICRYHGWPIPHRRAIDPPDQVFCKPYWQRGELKEPLSVWRQLSRQAASILNIAAQLHKGKCGNPEDWDVLHVEQPDRDGESKVWLERLALSSTLRTWIRLGAVEPSLSWGKGLSLEFGGAGLTSDGGGAVRAGEIDGIGHI